MRIQFPFQARVTYNTSGYDHVKEVVHDIMVCAKQVDRNAKLCPWEANSNERILNGNEAKILANETMIKYIDMPEKPSTLEDKKIYYQNGIRIQTNINTRDFVNTRSQRRCLQRER